VFAQTVQATQSSCSHNPSKDVTGQTSTLVILPIV